MSPKPSGSLSWPRKIGYASGDFALNLFFTFTSLFLLYYYTDVLGITPTQAGLVIMVALVWEGIIDPLMGVIANRTRSRWGRYRPYLLFGAVPLSGSFVAMFLPTGLSGTALLVYVFASHLLFRTFYTVVGIPLIAISADITSDSIERSSVAGARMLFAMLCGLTLATLSLPLVDTFGGGQRGYFILSIVFGVVATLVLGIVFMATGRGGHAETIMAAPVPSIAAMARMVASNRPFLLLLAAVMFGSIGSTVGSKALLYYMKYYAGSEASVTTALMLSTASAALAVLPWLHVTKRTSKRFVWLAGTAISVTSAMLLFLLAPKVGALLWALIMLGGIGASAYALTFWSMVPDTVEYGEWHSGVRAEGALYGLVSLSQKVALGLGIGLLGILLDVIGYRANEPQGPDTLAGVKLLLTVVPAGLALVAGACIWFYPLDRRTHSTLVSNIQKRRAEPMVP
jgi:GPH family glycoside/pentoside/hexuronide:cation symporter